MKHFVDFRKVNFKTVTTENYLINANFAQNTPQQTNDRDTNQLKTHVKQF